MYDKLKSLEYLENFTKVVSLESFTEAAKVLHLTPSALSKQVTQLEHELGISLIERSTRRFKLTDAGELFYASSYDIVNRMKILEAELIGANNKNRFIKISCPFLFGDIVANSVSKIIASDSNLKINIDTQDNLLNIIENKIDICIRVTEKNPESSLIARKISPYKKIVCATPLYLKLNKIIKVPADLKIHNVALFYVNKIEDEIIFIKNNEEESLTLKGRLHTSSSFALKSFALSGAGLAYLPYFIVKEEIKIGSLLQVLSEFEIVNVRSVYLIYLRTKVKDKIVSQIIKQLALDLKDVFVSL